MENIDDLARRLQRTYSMENIICNQDGQDFRSCTYSFGLKNETFSTLLLVLVCNPNPGELNAPYIIGHNYHGLNCHGHKLSRT